MTDGNRLEFEIFSINKIFKVITKNHDFVFFRDLKDNTGLINKPPWNNKGIYVNIGFS